MDIYFLIKNIILKNIKNNIKRIDVNIIIIIIYNKLLILRTKSVSFTRRVYF